MTNPAAGTSSAAQRSMVAAADYLSAAPTLPKGTRPFFDLDVSKECVKRGGWNGAHKIRIAPASAGGGFLLPADRAGRVSDRLWSGGGLKIPEHHQPDG